MTTLDIYVESVARFRKTPEYKLAFMLKGLAAAGYDWRLIDGPRSLPRNPAPAAFFHVDLSDLPHFFRDKWRRHERHINGCAYSIRKSQYVTGLLSRDTDYDGPAIVKTDLNFRGIPEKRYAWRQSLTGKINHLRNWLIDRDYIANASKPYPIYASVGEIPSAVWDDASHIVEKFHPPSTTPPIIKHRVDFFMRNDLVTRSTFSDALCTADYVNDVKILDESPPPEVTKVRERLQLDYGAIDYFETPNGVEIIDANKTIGLTQDWVDEMPAVAKHARSVTETLIAFVEGRL